ncbi:MAG: hypothetical protein OXG91_01325 [bacterium]|nr:hypothetical protein [bacterium]
MADRSHRCPVRCFCRVCVTKAMLVALPLLALAVTGWVSAGAAGEDSDSGPDWDAECAAYFGDGWTYNDATGACDPPPSATTTTTAVPASEAACNAAASPPQWYWEPRPGSVGLDGSPKGECRVVETAVGCFRWSDARSWPFYFWHGGECKPARPGDTWATADVRAARCRIAGQIYGDAFYDYAFGAAGQCVGRELCESRGGHAVAGGEHGYGCLYLHADGTLHRLPEA